SGGPNFAYDLCVRKVTEEQKKGLDLSSWTVAFNGAEPVRAETLERFAAAFSSCGFRRETYYPCYGLAEATLIVSGGRKSDAPLIKRVRASALEHNLAAEASHLDEDAREMVSCGRSLGEQEVAIVDPETLTRRQPGEIGEIWVSGRSVSQGYWNRPEETQRTFRASIADTGEGPFLRTGDLGFMQDGELFIAGRLKDLLIIRGRNHYPQDIELTVERTDRSLRPGCGAAFSIDVSGEERLVIVQEVELRQQPDPEAVIASIRQRVAEHHELQVYAVSLIKGGTIPKTSSGKIQRQATKAAFLKGELETISAWRAADSNDLEIGTESLEAPAHAAGDVQRWLVSQVASKLNVAPSEIDVDLPITRYGVDSLMDIELVHSIEAELGVTLPVLSFLQGATIAEISSQVLGELRRPSGFMPTSLEAARRDRSEHPLSRGQQALWFLHQLDPNSAAYNIGGVARIPGAIDPEALGRAFQSLVERHASLRTSFSSHKGNPIQRVNERVAVRFRHVDASKWSEEELRARLIEEAHRPFDLEDDSLLRVALFTRSDREHFLSLTVHHIVADLWSLSVLLEELSLFYDAQLSGSDAGLPPLTLQYADYVRWQEAWLAGERGEQLWRYWKTQLAGELPVLNLPTDRPRPAVQTYRGKSQGLALDSELAERLKAIARDNEATLYMVLLAAFEVLLHRYSGQEDILIGTPTSGRGQPQLQRLAGYLVNPVVVRADLSGRPTFLDHLSRVRRSVLSAFEHQDFPFPLLVERLEPERDPSRSPIFQVMFVLQKAPLLNEQGFEAFALGEDSARIELGGLTLESVRLERQVAQFDVTLKMAEVEKGINASLQYNTDLFDDETIARILSHFRILLDAIAADPRQRISELPLIEASQQRRMLVEWNETRTVTGPATTLDKLFEEQAERTPENVAVVIEGEEISYGELNRRANQLGGYLRSRGVGPEVRVAICAERSIEMIVGILGVLKAGGAYVPLDPAYPRQRLAFMLDDSRPRIVLAQTRLAGLIEGQQFETLFLDDESQEFLLASSDPVESGVSGENLAYVIYTSGSTGAPKGVMISHAAIVNHLRWRQRAFPLREGEAFLQKASFGFDISVWEIFGTLINGGRLVMARPGDQQDCSALVKLIAEEGIRAVHFGPAMLEVFIREDGLDECTELKRIFCGGEPLSLELMQRVTEHLDVELINQYGPTETCIDVLFGICERQPRGRQLAIGRPIDNTRAYILDKEKLLVPVGVAGELYIAGASLGRGYMNRPDLTAESFVPNPYAE
ncbi:MAG TPA: amino acid adenylation domain-containing protein, partial [Blastocatellia bacterium]|nr:amino acid adenylation domain-containing protein [Blastocatellia bacterium]